MREPVSEVYVQPKLQARRTQRGRHDDPRSRISGMLPDGRGSRPGGFEGDAVIHWDARYLSYDGEQALFVAGNGPRQHVGVSSRAAYSQNHEQESALEHEAFAVAGDGESIEETLEQIELGKLLCSRRSILARRCRAR